MNAPDPLLTPPPPPKRYELKKYQAGYFLLCLFAILTLVGWYVGSWQMAVAGMVMGITGVVFQFDKTRHQ